MRPRTDRGVALVQVLVMAVILLTLTTGVVKLIFGTHVMVARGQADIEAKSEVEECLALINRDWRGQRCRRPIQAVCGNEFSDSTCDVNTGAINIVWRR